MSGFFAFVVTRRNCRCARKACNTAFACPSMTPPNLLLSSTQALSSVSRRMSYASIERGSIIVGFEAGTEARPDIGGALGIEPVPWAEELPFAVEASRPTDDKAMSSRREVAASSRFIRVVRLFMLFVVAIMRGKGGMQGRQLVVQQGLLAGGCGSSRRLLEEINSQRGRTDGGRVRMRLVQACGLMSVGRNYLRGACNGWW